ncbi:hypothetical protein AL471_014380 [Vibrio alginolyticus]|uniref:hypothetical protein n=1 Tax=Vibrio alginolyticus TaxID=663 RepID=UPI00076D3885|nr:hypothetical protein [Vibrio alginolyticus]PNP21959.1 hypothetical protein AL471_014380 [Vibrio alginolyticus]
MNTLDVMGLSVDSFTWFGVENVDVLVARGLPQIVNEFTINSEPLTITVVDNNEVPDYDEMKIAILFKGAFLPVYENGDFYVKPDGSYATRKRSDGYALLGIRNES